MQNGPWGPSVLALSSLFTTIFHTRSKTPHLETRLLMARVLISMVQGKGGIRS